MIGGVPWRPWDVPFGSRAYPPVQTEDGIGNTVSERMPLHPGVIKYRHDLFMTYRRERQWVGKQELDEWFTREMRARGQLSPDVITEMRGVIGGRL
jgi:hypothetical protein